MKQFALFTAFSFVAAGSTFAQQCDLVNDNFDNAPLLAPITAVAGWTAGFTAPATIQQNGATSSDRAAQINTFGFGGVSTASRIIPASSTGYYTVSIDIEAGGGDTGIFALDCTQGIASQVFYSGSILSSIYGGALTVPSGSVSLRYDVSDATGYTLYVNGAFFESMSWPPTLCATRPTVTISAPLSFGGGAVNFDNLCIETAAPFSIGTNYCAAVPNSTGSIADIVVVGSPVVADNNVELQMSNMPSNSFGFFIVGMTQAFTQNPGGSSGNLCLSGSIGRYVGPGQIMNGGPQGMIALPIDLAQTPQPNGFVAINAGETWNFQGWHRDTTPSGGTTTNFSEGCAVIFQ